MSHVSRVIAVTGGKGGVGKSNVSLNLAITLAELGRRVTLLDANLGLANIDVLLGLKANCNIEDVLSGEKSIADIMVDGRAASKWSRRRRARKGSCNSVYRSMPG